MRKLSATLRHSLPVLLSTAVTCLMGCRTPGYYLQAVQGHCQIWNRQQPIASLLEQPQTPDPLKARLRLVLALREFAAQELHLPVDGHYLRYADLGRDYVVWNVSATPEFSLNARTWWYPVVGSVTYRGYFSEAAARQHAGELARAGLDVDVGGVRAYSTLGWFRDPVLNTFLQEPEADLAELIFHELAHQRLFVSGDTEFSEAFAEAVGEEGTRRWLRAHRSTTAVSDYEAHLRRKAEFTRLVTGAHDRLAALFRDTSTDAKSREELRTRKQAILDQLKQDYEMLKFTWNEQTDYERWFQRPLNNARLNNVDTYYRLVPAFHRLLREQEGDLEAFYRAAEALAKLPKEARHQRLGGALPPPGIDKPKANQRPEP